MATAYTNPITLDTARFRAAFPAFANDTKFPDAMLQVQWDIGTAYVTDANCGVLVDSKRETALWLMLAHLLWLGFLISRNRGGVGVKTQARIDKVQVVYEAPPPGDSWTWWLQQTPYGQQLLALLSIAGAGGFYGGGLPETTALRKWAGVY